MHKLQFDQNAAVRILVKSKGGKHQPHQGIPLMVISAFRIDLKTLLITFKACFGLALVHQNSLDTVFS